MSRLFSFYKAHKLIKPKQDVNIPKPTLKQSEDDSEKKIETTIIPQTTSKTTEESTEKYHKDQRTKFYLFGCVIFVLLIGVILSLSSTQIINKKFSVTYKISTIIIPLLEILILISWNRYLLFFGGILYLFEAVLLSIQGFSLLLQSDVNQAKISFTNDPIAFQQKYNCQCWSADYDRQCNLSASLYTCERIIQVHMLESFLEIAGSLSTLMVSFYLFIVFCTLSKKSIEKEEDTSSQYDPNTTVISESDA